MAGKGGRKPRDVKAIIERYTIVEVHRSELKNAPYNPRVMRANARAKLQKSMEKLGLLAPLTWNATTGNIVGGHQRISLIDASRGTKDYRLQVARVELSELEEKEANLILNNYEAMGDWDLEKLGEMVDTPGLDLDATGFDSGDLFQLLGRAPSVKTDQGFLDELAERCRAMQQAYNSMSAEADTKDDQDFYVVVVFRDQPMREGWLTQLGLEDNRYQDGRTILECMRRGGWTPPAPPATEEGSAS